MRRPFWVRAAPSALAILLSASIAGAQQPTPDITDQELIDHVRYLADDDLEGRAAGSEGALHAAEYIGAEFERLGLVPIGDGGSYFQGFELPRGFKALPDTSLIAFKGKKEISFNFGKHIYPLPTSARGVAEGEAVFVGYGISAPDLGYDDYDGIDVSGKIVLVMRGLPNSDRKENHLKGAQAQKRYASFRAKQDTASGLGAAGLIVVNDPANYGKKSKDKLVTSSGESQGTIPSLHMTCVAARKLFSMGGLSLSKLQKAMDGRLEPHSRALSSVRLRLNASLVSEKLEVRNVVGLLKAPPDQRKEEVLVVGAHFDHIGLGEYGSLGGSKARGEVHNGADDNASGTAAVMEIAGYLAARADQLRRDVLFICFTAEELGLLGSEHYVDAPLIPNENVAAMLNLDMVSYLSKTGKLEVYGTGTSPTFSALIKDESRSARVKVRSIEGVGRGASDHYPFYKKSLPVLFFITGLHKNYHRPSDDTKAIDKRGFGKVVRMVGEVALHLVTAEQRPVFTPTSEGGMETGPYLGLTVERREGALFIDQVTKKSPASRAGLKVDDQILEVAGTEVSSVATFNGVWAGVSPGKKIAFLVRRSGRIRTIGVQLKK